MVRRAAQRLPSTAAAAGARESGLPQDSRAVGCRFTKSAEGGKCRRGGQGPGERARAAPCNTSPKAGRCPRQCATPAGCWPPSQPSRFACRQPSACARPGICPATRCELPSDEGPGAGGALQLCNRVGPHAEGFAGAHVARPERPRTQHRTNSASPQTAPLRRNQSAWGQDIGAPKQRRLLVPAKRGAEHAGVSPPISSLEATRALSDRGASVPRFLRRTRTEMQIPPAHRVNAAHRVQKAAHALAWDAK